MRDDAKRKLVFVKTEFPTGEVLVKAEFPMVQGRSLKILTRTRAKQELSLQEEALKKNKMLSRVKRQLSLQHEPKKKNTLISTLVFRAYIIKT